MYRAVCYSQTALLLATFSFIILLTWAIMSSPVLNSFRQPGNEDYTPNSTNKLLKRKFLYRRLPPDIREAEIKVLSARDTVAMIDHLVAYKHKRPYRYFDGESQFFELHRYNETKRFEPRWTFHFAFIGDSRIRQLFTTFYQALPDSDILLYPSGVEFQAAVFTPPQMVAYSEMLSSVISFDWYGLLIEEDGRDIFKHLKKWLGYRNSDETFFLTHPNHTTVRTPRPDFLLIGMGAHHMLSKFPNAHEDVFFEKLNELVLVLQNISKDCHVIWLNQYPTQEFFGRNDEANTDVHSQKIWHYNLEANRIVRNAGIPIWDSGSPIAEENIRSCLLYARKDGYNKGYFNCDDYIHPSGSAISDIIQILNNLILYMAN